MAPTVAFQGCWRSGSCDNCYYFDHGSVRLSNNRQVHQADN